MESRSSQLRRRHRKALGWSMLAAAIAHVAVFALVPGFRAPFQRAGPDWLRSVTEAPLDMRTIDVTFGPPLIHLPNGSLRQEPPERFLDAHEVSIRGIVLPSHCAHIHAEGFGEAAGAVRLHVGPNGATSNVSVAASTGDPCTDQVLVVVAGTLVYRWLPDEEAPAPVDLVQPMRARPTTE